MKFIRVLIAAVLVLSMMVPAYSQGQSNKVELKTKSDTLSYCIGIINGANAARSNFPRLNTDAMGLGYHDFFKPEAGAIFTPAQANQFLNNYMREMFQLAGKEQLRIGQEFLDKNAKNEGVVTTESGLQYKVLRPGTGANPTASSRVKVHYKGAKLDGEQFDSSYDRGQPTEFGLSGVIAGWTEGIQYMTPGSKFIFWIPGPLAYGENGNPRAKIAPNQLLVFEVELLEIVK